MFIPPQNLKGYQKEASNQNDILSLQSSHLFIGAEIAAKLFPGEPNAYVVYYPDRKSLLVAPASDDLFKQLHKAKQHILKDRNLKGDKTIALYEILVDHQIDDSDRALNYTLNEGLGILNIEL